MMGLDNLVAVVERFFNDIIATLLPGFILLFGLSILAKQRVSENLYPDTFVPEIALVLVLAYPIGHALTALTNILTLRLSEVLLRVPIVGSVISFSIRSLQSRDSLNTRIREDLSFVIVAEHYDVTDDEVSRVPISNLRNLAISMLDDVDTNLVHRFRFLCLMNGNLATTTVIFCVLYLVLFDNSLILVLVFIILSVLFLERYYRFNSITMRIPFNMAAIMIKDLKDERRNEG